MCLTLKLKLSTIKPTLLAEVWVSQPKSCKHGKAVPTTRLSYGGAPLPLASYRLQQKRELTMPLT